ncbi:ABC transporter substrate-binding protein [Paenibacillus thalictri]|uniref:Carbohydrate ABC transporter substrate-binding protein n=1 Tax=Paenibacillus thalictri TaxID=2527873 RepID=A0A4Q9DMB1_9BACL|nr:ABC transporter substrate-binding protein [Paenibacillus thalictri]TBL76382.1 carbohydrate ABC transporter substrate-binding protein [Paenibacillus thalictri]
MKLSKSIAASLLAASLTAAAGCSGSGDGGEAKQKEASGGAGQQQIKLEFLSNKADTVTTMDKIIKKFQEQNKNIVIEQNAPPNMLKVLAMRFSTNEAPQLFHVYPSAPSFSQLLKDDNVQEITGDPILQNVDPKFITFSQNNGKNYAFPYALEGYGVVYNPDMFKELNLEVPKTYAELIRVADKLKAAGKTPFLFADKEYTDLRRISAAMLALDDPNIIPFFQDVIAGKKHIADNPVFAKFIEKTLEMRKYAQKDLLGLSGDNAVREMAAGKAAMYFMGMWQAAAVKKANPSMNVDMFVFPADKAEDAKVAMQVGTALAMPKGVKNQAEIKKFMEFFATTEMSQLYADETQNISVVKGVKHNSKETKVLADMAAAGKIYRAADSPWTPAMQDDFGKATQELIATGNKETYMKKLEDIFYNKAGK